MEVGKGKEEMQARKNLQKACVHSSGSQVVVGKYLTHDQIYQEATNMLAIFVGANNIPNNIVDNPNFRNFLAVILTQVGSPLMLIIICMHTNLLLWLVSCGMV